MTKTLPGNLKNTLSVVVKKENYVRGWAIKHRLFQLRNGFSSSCPPFPRRGEMAFLMSNAQQVYEIHKEIIQFLKKPRE